MTVYSAEILHAFTVNVMFCAIVMIWRVILEISCFIYSMIRLNITLYLLIIWSLMRCSVLKFLHDIFEYIVKLFLSHSAYLPVTGFMFCPYNNMTRWRHFSRTRKIFSLFFLEKKQSNFLKTIFIVFFYYGFWNLYIYYYGFRVQIHASLCVQRERYKKKRHLVALS